MEVGTVDFSLIVSKLISLLLNPAGARSELEDVAMKASLATSAVFIAIISFLQAIGTSIGLYTILASRLGGIFRAAAGAIIGRAVISAIFGVIVALIGWVILGLITFVLGKALRGEKVSLVMEEFGPLLSMLAFASAPSIILVIPFAMVNFYLYLLVALAIGVWSYYYTWLSAKVYFGLDNVKALIATIVQLLMLLWSLYSAWLLVSSPVWVWA